MPHAVVVLADGFEEVEAVAVIDLLRRAGVRVTMLGLDGFEVRGAHDVWVRADRLFGDFGEPFDALVLPGGGPGTARLAASEPLLKLVRSANGEGKLCAAICAAPTVFAKAGILDNKKAACYPGCEDKMAVAVLVEDAVAVDGNIITSRAAGTAIPFALEIISALMGEEVEESVRDAILY
ncbi:MAG: DJ-1/PfpI family protein [Chitinispirillales bacterium]|jgi:4-methyl-5(b-hydroxyethyl)-thiazole monophosphate biosynthesis|nr:DJ-1/PfpI family protein [Chitinispirillales bacterium]